MPRHAGFDHDALGHVQGREQRGRAMALVVVRHRAQAARDESAGPSACDPGPESGSSRRRTTRCACSGGFKYRPTTSTSFSANCGSLDSLNVFTRCGCKPLAFHTRCTIAGEVPNSAASVRVLQWVAAGGFSVVVLRMISAATSAARPWPGRHAERLSRCPPAPTWQIDYATGRRFSFRCPTRRRCPCSTCRPRPRARSWPATPTAPASFVRATNVRASPIVVRNHNRLCHSHGFILLVNPSTTETPDKFPDY